MGDSLAVEDVIDALRKRGDTGQQRTWADGDPDYIAEYSLTRDHVPALIELATTWVAESPENPVVYAPVHAWRALGQLRAVEAVQPLLDVQDELDEVGDDWYLEEFHDVFGLIGPPAIPLLASYLADITHGEFPRGKAAAGLREIARRFPETRSEVVAILAGELARHHRDTSDLNGSLVGDLMNLGAAEAAGTIELAFAANVIDPTIAGDWGDVREELGVPGLGIAPDRSPGWPTLRERFGLAGPSDEFRERFVPDNSSDEPWDPVADRRTHFDAKREARAKRKSERKNRKRNRKSR